MRGGRSLSELNRLAASARKLPHMQLDEGRGGGVAFLCVSVDPTPHAARASAAQRWPHLEHYWIDGGSIGELDIGFVPNRVVIDGRLRVPKVLRWWDGTAGNVLKGPHGKSRRNGSHRLLVELQAVLASKV